MFYFFFTDTATTEIYTYLHTLSLHDALPILPTSIDASTRSSPITPIWWRSTRSTKAFSGCRCCRTASATSWPRTRSRQIGRAHVCTPVTNTHLVCRLLLEKKNIYSDSCCQMSHHISIATHHSAYIMQC